MPCRSLFISEKYYEEGFEIASKKLKSSNPARLCLVLNYAVFQFEVKSLKDAARQMLEKVNFAGLKKGMRAPNSIFPTHFDLFTSILTVRGLNFVHRKKLGFAFGFECQAELRVSPVVTAGT
ncbi:hypothetical protein niasHS_008467 [Heterodera schachtii]|uniref:14-3-3 domain-containing protein n=1 Tax=Heterodera schachtii TaxID=97005 RepID=A0ABD2J045_HETSC